MTITVKHKFVSAIPDEADATVVRPSNWNDTHDIVGLGTSASLDAGVANGVATLDSSGTVPLSQIPALGDLNYQGTWNATTNSPTLTSSVGTKGFYYVVSVAGTTSLNGITDWQIGDWAVFNGSVWQKIDNTDAVTSVNGYTGTVVLTAADVSAVPYTGATGAVDLNAKSLVNVSNLGINTTTVPTIKIRAVGDNNSGSRIAMRGYSSDANSSSIRVTKFRGTTSAPQAPQSGDSLGKFELAGYGTTSSEGYPQSSLEGVATENWGATARGAKAVIKVTPNTTTTQVTALTIDQNSAATFASSVAATSFSGSGSSLTGVVTSVATNGTVNGITLTGGPITSTGTVTLGGTLDLSSPPTIGNTSANTGAFTTLKASGNTLLAQSYDQGTGVLQVTGQSTFNGVVVDKTLSLQGGNNLVLQSQTFSNASWSTHVAGTATANVTTAPDGTSTGNSLSEGTTTNYHDVYQNITPTGTYTLTCYGKNNTGTYLNISLGSSISAAAAIFNLSTGVVSNTVSNGYTLISSSINSVGNGWYRCSITATTNAACTAFVAMSNTTTLPTTFGINNYTGTSNSIYIWGAQLELGTVASAYTPTTTAAITTTNNISVPSGQVLAQAGTAALPSLSMGLTNTGFFYSSAAISASIAGASYGYFSTSGFGLGSLPIQWANGISGAPDAFIYRDAANTLAQRNSTNAQTFRLYNTYTDASNYERLSIDWSTTTNTATIVTQNAGTGSARTLAIGQDLYVNTVRVGLGGGSASTATAVGYQALNANVSGGAYKTAVGYQALLKDTVATGSWESSAFGYLALSSNISGIQNNAFGSNALKSNTGSYNTAFGHYALSANTSANQNTGFGASVLSNNTTGATNLGFGYNALNANITGSSNVGIGGNTLDYNISGSSSVAVGAFALHQNTTVGSLTAVGASALQNNTTNVATLGSITGGSSYTNGTYTGVVMTLSSGSSAITYPTATIVVAGGAVTTVTITSAGVGFKDTTTVLTAPAASIGGTGSGFSVPVATLQSGTGNVAVGYQAGYTNSVGTNGTYVGYQAGYSNSTGVQNTNYGYFSGQAITSGNYNTCVGVNAGQNILTQNYNTCVGRNAYLGYGIGNSAFGAGALQSAQSGNYCVAVGFGAGFGNASANANTTGSNNTYLGYQTVGSANNNTNEMVIGYTAVGLGSNTTVIGNSSTTRTKVFGAIESSGYTVSTLPTGTIGMHAYVTDGDASLAWGATVVNSGSGTTKYMVWFNGTNWTVMGK